MAASSSKAISAEGRARFAEGSPEHQAYLLGQQDVMNSFVSNFPPEAKEVTTIRVLGFMNDVSSCATGRLAK